MKKILCLLLCASLVLLNGCGKKASTAAVSLVEDGKLMYRVIRPSSIKKDQLETYTDFYTELKKSVKIDSETDSSEKFEREVLLGNTKRDESKEALKRLNSQKKESCDYIIAVINGKIVVTSNDEIGLALGFTRFLNDYVKKNKAPADDFSKVYFGADEKEPDAAIVGKQQNLDGYKLVWSEEFDGDELDTKKIQRRDVALNKPANSTTVMPKVDPKEYVYVKDGMLHMAAKRYKDGFLSGGIKTSSTMRYCYGYLEAKVRLPQGKGYWPAFWLNAANLGYKMAPEIDIYEIFGTQNELVFNLHIWSGTDSTAHYSFDGGTLGSFIKKDDRSFKLDDTAAFHTYGLEWTPDYLAASVDGMVYYKYYFSEQENYKEWMAQELYVLFGSGVLIEDSDSTQQFANANETNRAPMDATTPDSEQIVDYIRLYQKDGVKGSSLTTRD